MAGVIDAAVQAIGGRGASSVRAVVGPCISPAHYEFGVAELEKVAHHIGPVVRSRREEGTQALDLRAGVAAALAGAGVVDRADVDVCTYESANHFSHRRDGMTGRQALIVTRGS